MSRNVLVMYSHEDANSSEEEGTLKLEYPNAFV
jgi:hypothetical protein